jgi:murein DD-endopeptidase MepM/ murein hydrolase activator NlpD
MLNSPRTTARSTLLAFIIGGMLAGPAGAAVPDTILFPVVGPTQYQDDFGDPRGNHTHQGNDIMAARGAPVVAVEPGKARIYRGSSSAGCMLYFYGDSGTVYYYIHLNDDLTKKDDNKATDCRKGVAYAKNLRNDQHVRAGALIGYVGNSGDARGISPHLHFELHPNGGRARSPYPWLKKGPHLLWAVQSRTPTVRLALVGIVKPFTKGFTLRVNQVYVASGWRGKPVPRTVNLGLDPALVVERLKDGAWVPAKLTGAKEGERTTALTTWFKPTLKTQLPQAGDLTAVRVRLRGLAP